MAIKGGLGKGLNALLKDTKMTPAKDRVQEIPVAKICANRYQPRQEFDESALEELKESVKRIGILQPLLVRKLPSGSFELIAGERRLRAAKLAGLETVPAMIREYSDAQISEIALIENIQRENLNAMEEAQAYSQLMKDFGLTQEEIAVKIGRSRSHIANFLRLLKLEPQVQNYVANGTLSMGQVKPLISLEQPAWQREAAEYIQLHDLSARQCEQLVKKILADPDFFAHNAQRNDHDSNAGSSEAYEDKEAVFIAETKEKLTHLLGTQVKILSGKKKSKIEIEFYSPEDLDRIVGTIISLQDRDRVHNEKIEALRKVSLSDKFTV